MRAFDEGSEHGIAGRPTFDEDVKLFGCTVPLFGFAHPVVYLQKVGQRVKRAIKKLDGVGMVKVRDRYTLRITKGVAFNWLPIECRIVIILREAMLSLGVSHNCITFDGCEHPDDLPKDFIIAKDGERADVPNVVMGVGSEEDVDDGCLDVEELGEEENRTP